MCARATTLEVCFGLLHNQGGPMLHSSIKRSRVEILRITTICPIAARINDAKPAQPKAMALTPIWLFIAP